MTKTLVIGTAIVGLLGGSALQAEPTKTKSEAMHMTKKGKDHKGEHDCAKCEGEAECKCDHKEHGKKEGHEKHEQEGKHEGHDHH